MNDQIRSARETVDTESELHSTNHRYDTGSVVTKKSARSLMSASAKTIDDGHSLSTKSKLHNLVKTGPFTSSVFA